MANNFNFTAKIGLNSAGFHKGVNRVKNSLNSLKSTFLSLAGALGAGLGFTQLIGSIKTTATELSNAMNTLKNVSYQTKYFKDGTKEMSIEVSNFSENLAFVKKLSSDYHQDLVAITDNYAKFTAACKKTTMGLDDQRFVFEALTKAAAYYHLSADRTNDMMNAVVQMMSKGKVAAEELRRQLGNTLPGAFNMMAAAIGVSTAELEDMMKKGQVISSEVLPRFAAMLNSVTQTAEFDSIQASMNDLKNAWYEFVQESGAENLYKNILSGAASAVKSVTNNFDTIKASVKGLIAFILAQNIWGSFIRNGQVWLAEQEKQLKMSERALGAYYMQVKELQTKNLVTQSASGAISPVAGATLSPQNAKAILDYNNQLLKTARLQAQLGTISTQRFKAIERSVHQANAALTGFNVGLDTAGKKGMTTASMIGTSFRALGAKIKGIFASIGNFLKVNWVFLLIGAVTTLVSKARQAREEIERINNIANEYANETVKVKGTIDSQASILRNNLGYVKNQKLSEEERLYALKEINKQLGLTGKDAYTLDTLDKIKGKYKNITEAVEEWIKATQKQALVQHYANQIAELTAKKADAKRRQDAAWSTWAEWEAGGDVGIIEGSKAKDAWQKANAEIVQYDRAIRQAQADMEKAGIEMGAIFSKWIDSNSNDNDSGESLSKIYDKYLKEEKELANQLSEGALTQEEYNEAFDKLVQEFWKKAAATGELSIEKLTEKFDKGTTLEKMEQWYYDLAKNAKEAAMRALLAEAGKAMEQATDETIKEQEKIINDQIDAYLDEEAKKFEKQLNLDAGVLGGDYVPDKRKDRNTLFDYGKKGSEITNEELEQTNAWLDSIKGKYKDLIQESNELGYRTEIVQKELDELSELYRYAAKEAKTLEAAMNYQKVVEDIKDVKKELNNLVYSGVKDFATSLDRVVSAWDTLEKTMEDNDATGWEKFMAIFNMMTQIIDSAIGIFQTINTIQQLQTKLGAAKIAEQAALNELLKQELAYRMAINGASDAEIQKRIASLGTLFAEEGLLAGILGLKKKENQVTATGIAMKGAEAGVTAAAASASAGEAVANATASGAKMPFPLNLAAIALGIGAVVAALATMSKFANGGIVGGNAKHGDRNIARVNSGEMILNKAQQGTLWGLLNGKGSIGGNVEFKIRGADLVGTINNYSKKISK